MPTIINTAETDYSQLSGFRRNAIYNAMDVLITGEVFEVTNSHLDELTRETYKYSRALQGPVMSMMLNGVLVDQQLKAEYIASRTAKMERLERVLADFADAVGFRKYVMMWATRPLLAKLREANVDTTLVDLAGDKAERRARSAIRAVARAELKKFDDALKACEKPFNGRSVKQKCTLLYEVLELKPITKRSKTTGLVRPVADRDALEKLLKLGEGRTEKSRYFWARPFVRTILALMDIAKELDELKSSVDTDGYYRYALSIAGTNTGRFSSGSNPEGKGGNFQNKKDILRRIFTVPKDWKLAYIDLEQAESRCVGAIAYSLFGEINYLAATESGDLHTLNASLVWPKEPWPADFTLENAIKYGRFPTDILKAAKKVASKEFYRGKSYRDTSKPLDHGSNYYGRPPQMAVHTKIPTEIIADFQARKFEAFPAIRKWHRHTAEQLQTTRTIVSMFGRKRIFFGRPYEDETLRKAIAFNPQSATADYMGRGILRVWRWMIATGAPIKLIGQVHDAIAFAYPEELEPEIIPTVSALLEPKIRLNAPNGESRIFSIPVEATVGWNLGKAKADNPDGLVTYDFERGDTRVRSRLPALSVFDFLTIPMMPS